MRLLGSGRVIRRGRAALAATALLVLVGAGDCFPAEIERVEGMVQAWTAERKAWVQCSPGAKVQPGDTIHVAGDGKAAARLDDGSRMDIGAGTRITVGKRGDPSVSVVLAEGAVTVTVPKAAAKPFLLRAPAVVCSGTDVVFEVSTGEGGRSRVRVHAGQLSVTDNGGNAFVLQAKGSREFDVAAAPAVPASPAPAARPVPAGRPVEAASRTAAAASKPQRQAAASQGRPATFEDIMADPDNVELNVRYAKDQLDSGNLHGAAATLDRILLLDPTNQKVRLLYAAVLFRLGGASDAERELGELSQAAVPDELQKEADELKRQIERKQRLTHVTATLALGYDYDTNRNASPRTSERLALNRVVMVTGKSLKADDTGVLAVTNVRVSRDLPFQAGHQVFASGGYYRSQQMDLNNIDLQAYSWQTGVVIKTPFADLTGSGNFLHLRLSEETYLRSQGGSLTFDRQVGPVGLSLTAYAAYEDYSRTSVVLSAPERNGRRYGYSVSGGAPVTKTVKTSLGFGYYSKEAVRRYNASQAYTLNAGVSWAFWKGLTVAAAYAGTFERAETPDTLVGNDRARTFGSRVRIMLGVPLVVAHGYLRGMTLSTGYEFYNAASNIPNNSYDDHKSSTMLTYKFEL